MKKTILIILVMFFSIGCDQITKHQAVTMLKGNAPISFLGNFFSFQYAENIGGMLSIGSNLPENIRFYLFTIFVGLALLLGLMYFVIKPMTNISLIFGLLIISGGLGNLYDRIINNGVVVDFMVIQLGPIKTGIFNVADVAILAGMGGLLLFNTRNEVETENQSEFS